MTEGKKQAYLSKVVSGDIRGAQECLAATLREIRYSGGSYSPILFFDILIAYVDLLTDYCKQQDLYSEEYERNLKKWNVSTDNIRSEKMAPGCYGRVDQRDAGICSGGKEVKRYQANPGNKEVYRRKLYGGDQPWPAGGTGGYECLVSKFRI